jgi:hypothetical protein
VSGGVTAAVLNRAAAAPVPNEELLDERFDEKSISACALGAAPVKRVVPPLATWIAPVRLDRARALKLDSPSVKDS